MAPRKALGKAADKIGALIDDQLLRNNMTEEQANVARAANANKDGSQPKGWRGRIDYDGQGSPEALEDQEMVNSYLRKIRKGGNEPWDPKMNTKFTKFVQSVLRDAKQNLPDDWYDQDEAFNDFTSRWADKVPGGHSGWDIGSWMEEMMDHVKPRPRRAREPE